MARETIYAVDDEEDILDLVEYVLSKEKFKIQRFNTGEEVLNKIRVLPPDLLLLDLMLPGVDGLDVCRKLKSDPDLSSIPIIMLTAKGEESDIVTGLELGADDYIPKPFSPKVLAARVKAVLRRKLQKPPDDYDIIKIHDISIHPGRHEVSYKDKRIELTYTEFKMLHFLAKRPGWVFTRYQIVDALRGEDYPVTERAVDVQIVGLRKKLGEAGRIVETVRGVGYRVREY
ncbi:MAG: response regulator [Calditrichaceae bacterium]|nr:response regulator [Calditrichaceae bacterium]MBN2709113.1 response regulator [Calditrichaceae bacterium]RQV96069.1 MAG: response regulator [Calditrichota bacterium]